MEETKIKYIVEAYLWFDKINGNTYHSVNIINTDNHKLIYSSGLTYGYGEQYKETAKSALINLGLLNPKDKYNHEVLRNMIYYSVHENSLKKDLKKIEVD